MRKSQKGVSKGRVIGRGRGRSRVGKQAIETAEKYARVLTLRKEGFSLQEIADRLGYSHPSEAHQALTRAIAQTVGEPAEELRTLELERLDYYLRALNPKVEKGDVQSIETALRISARQAKLLGLDAPSRTRAEVELTAATFEAMPQEEQIRLVVGELRSIGWTCTPPGDPTGE